MQVSRLCTTRVLPTSRTVRLTYARTRLYTVRAVHGSSSYDSDSDDLLTEFQRYADPNRVQKATKRLELTWGVQRVCPVAALHAMDAVQLCL